MSSKLRKDIYSELRFDFENGRLGDCTKPTPQFEAIRKLIDRVIGGYEYLTTAEVDVLLKYLQYAEDSGVDARAKNLFAEKDMALLLQARALPSKQVEEENAKKAAEAEEKQKRYLNGLSTARYDLELLKNQFVMSSDYDNILNHVEPHNLGRQVGRLLAGETTFTRQQLALLINLPSIVRASSLAGSMQSGFVASYEQSRSKGVIFNLISAQDQLPSYTKAEDDAAVALNSFWEKKGAVLDAICARHATSAGPIEEMLGLMKTMNTDTEWKFFAVDQAKLRDIFLQPSNSIFSGPETSYDKMVKFSDKIDAFRNSLDSSSTDFKTLVKIQDEYLQTLSEFQSGKLRSARMAVQSLSAKASSGYGSYTGSGIVL